MSRLVYQDANCSVVANIGECAAPEDSKYFELTIETFVGHYAVLNLSEDECRRLAYRLLMLISKEE